METIDILDKLIEYDSSPLTLENNQELFSKFFLHDMSIKYGSKKVINCCYTIDVKHFYI